MTSTPRRYDLAQAPADYPAWPGLPERSLVVCTQQRSGSTLLGEALHAAGGLGCPLEYLHPGFRPRMQKRWGAADIGTFIAAMHRHRTDPSGTFAIKFFWQDFAAILCERHPDRFAASHFGPPAQMPPDRYRRIHEAIAEFLPAATWILLTRRNTLRQAVSLYVASMSREWRRLGDGPRHAKAKDADYDFLQIFILLTRIQERDAHWRRFFEATSLPCHHLYYEDIDADYSGTIRKLFTALGRPDAPITPPRLQKQADARSEELVQKFQIDFARRTGATAQAQTSPNRPSN